MDLSIDQGGCCETSRPTDFSNPTYEVDGIVHFCVPNLPSQASRASTRALTAAILPFIEDSEENIAEIVRQAHESGASYIIPAFGMTLRDRQRAYYYDKLDKHFPGLRQRYAQAFGNDYFAPVRNYHQLETHFKDLCSQYEIPTHMAQYQPFSAEQLSLF
jgi:DNA repair photolyase